MERCEGWLDGRVYVKTPRSRRGGEHAFMRGSEASAGPVANVATESESVAEPSRRSDDSERDGSAVCEMMPMLSVEGPPWRSHSSGGERRTKSNTCCLSKKSAHGIEAMLVGTPAGARWRVARWSQRWRLGW